MTCAFGLAALVLAPAGALGANFTGNGGEGIYCEGGGQPTVTSYDIFEAKVLFGLAPKFGEATDFVGLVENTLERLARFSPKRAARYRAVAKDFLKNSLMIEQGLQAIDDREGFLDVDPGCMIRQVVIQRTPVFPLDKRFVIDAKLWRMMSDVDQAALLLHEIVYGEAIEYGQSNSRAARAFNASIFSDYLDGKTQADFYRLLRSINFDRYEFGGYTFQLYESRGACRDSNFAVDYQRPLYASTDIYENGALDWGTLACGETFRLFDTVLQTDYMERQDRFIRFYPSGKPRLVVANQRGVMAPVQGYRHEIKKGTGVSLFENGELMCADMLLPHQLTLQDGKTLSCTVTGLVFSRFCFNENGYPEEWPGAYCHAL